MATPIGNLRDVTLRALDVLRTADVIAAEDTRHTRRLLDHYGIDAKLVSAHEHNERVAAQRVVTWLVAGRSVALVTDAGTPGVSDPGAALVHEVRLAGCRVVPVPGPSAIIAALSVAGIESSGFSFEGFLPAKKEARRHALERLLARETPTLMHEAPHRIRECVADMLDVLGPARRITFARELTKVFESVHECALGAALDWLDTDPNHARGEFVLVVHGVAQPADNGLHREGSRVLDLLMRELPPSQAAKLAARITGARKGDLYEEALRLKAASDSPEN